MRLRQQTFGIARGGGKKKRKRKIENTPTLSPEESARERKETRHCGGVKKAHSGKIEITPTPLPEESVQGK